MPILFPLAHRFLVGNKSDLRDPTRAAGQVSQEQAVNFAKSHSMMLFETSAKNPPTKGVNGQLGGRGVSYRHDKLEDVVLAVGTTLKRQKKHSSANALTYSGSFNVCLSKKRAEKDMWSCC